MPAPPRAGVQFGLIFAAHALGAMSLLSVLTAGPQLIAALGLSALQIGVLASLYSAALAAASLPAGLVADRLGTRGALSVAAVAIAVGLLSCGSADGFAQLGAGIALCGTGYGLINPAAGRAITLWFTPRWRTTLLSLKQTGVPAGAALGSATALLGPSLGWQAGIFCAAVIALFAGLLFVVLLPPDTPSPPPENQRISKLTEVLALPGLGRANVVAGLTNGIQFALWAHLPALVQLSFGTGDAVLGLCLGALHLGTFLGRLIWGALTDQLFQGNAARGLQLLSLTALAGVAALGAGTLVASPVVAVIACFILGFTACAAVGLHLALTALIAPDRLLGGAMGYTMLFTNLGGIVVPILLGFALSLFGVGGAALTFGVLLGLALLLLQKLR
jgi:MFS family permease